VISFAPIASGSSRPASTSGRESADRSRELRFPAEPDRDPDRRVVGVAGHERLARRIDAGRTADGEWLGCIKPPELASERRNHGGVEHGDGDGDALSTVLQRPAERPFERFERSIGEQVALGEHERDVAGRSTLVKAMTNAEIRIVQAHERRSRRAYKSSFTVDSLRAHAFSTLDTLSR